MPNPPRAQSSMPRITTILVFVLALFILFDPNLRNGLGQIIGYGLEPVIGFGGRYPVVTLFLAGIIMTGLTIIIRHFMVDYVEQVKSQKIVAAFNKEFRQARMENNTYKIKKLTEQQPKILQKSMEVSSSQIKLLPITMAVVVPIFSWLSVFMGNINSAHFAVPWSSNADMNAVYVLPGWILLYSLVSLPFGQVLARILRYFSFSKRLKQMKADAK
ncbi:MAG: EMC3/TMCO1 family protein [Methanomassiliicoccales archaeon]|nr:EMC3/TMCO1 family protein [Methanomassiliicoccales archaeon]